MSSWKPDPTFYPSARLAAEAPEEKVAYVASFDPSRKLPDEMAVVDEASKPVKRGVIGSLVVKLLFGVFSSSCMIANASASGIVL